MPVSLLELLHSDEKQLHRAATPVIVKSFPVISMSGTVWSSGFSVFCRPGVHFFYFCLSNLSFARSDGKMCSFCTWITKSKFKKRHENFYFVFFLACFWAFLCLLFVFFCVSCFIYFPFCKGTDFFFHRIFRCAKKLQNQWQFVWCTIINNRFSCESVNRFPLCVCLGVLDQCFLVRELETGHIHSIPSKRFSAWSWCGMNYRMCALHFCS